MRLDRHLVRVRRQMRVDNVRGDEVAGDGRRADPGQRADEMGPGGGAEVLDELAQAQAQVQVVQELEGLRVAVRSVA